MDSVLNAYEDLMTSTQLGLGLRGRHPSFYVTLNKPPHATGMGPSWAWFWKWFWLLHVCTFTG